MASQTSTFPAYRDVNNRPVNFNPALGTVPAQEDARSDFEPLLTSTPPNELDEDAVMRFTATGRPMPAFQRVAMPNMAGNMYSLPQLLPKRYTDDSIIPAIIVDVIPSPKPEGEQEKKKRRGSFLKKLKGERKDDKLGLVKVVYMPRGDYLKWFARGEKGEYIGTEPYKQWSEDELDAMFKQYKPAPVVRKGYRPPA